MLGNEKYGGQGDYTVEELQTTGSVLIVRFRSDNSVTHDGFELTVTVTAGAGGYDLNDDGAVDIGDVTALLNALSGGSAPVSFDLNGDDVVDILDVTELLNFLSGSAPDGE